MSEFTRLANLIPWERRKIEAVFRGSFQGSSSFTANGEPKYTFIQPITWSVLGRTHLRLMADKYPMHLDVRLQDLARYEKILAGYPHMEDDDDKYFLTLLEQVQQFKYQIVVEGHCGWADRLKVLLHSTAAIFLQETYCHEYYRFFLKPWIHYIPIKGDLSDLIEKIEWARANDATVYNITQNALKLGRELLNQKQMACWSDIILSKYAHMYSQGQ